MEGSRGVVGLPPFALRKNAVAIFNAPLLLNESSKLSCVSAVSLSNFALLLLHSLWIWAWTLA